MSTPSRSDSPPPAVIVTTPEQLSAIVRAEIEAALAEHAESAPSAEALIDQTECARRIGVSLPTLRKMDLPSVRCGDHPRYSWPEVLEHLRARRKDGAR